MKKQAVINLSEYYFNNNRESIKTMTIVLILFPLIFTTLINILELSANILMFFNGIKDGFKLQLIFQNVLSWNVTYNIYSLSASILKSFCFIIYSVGLYGIVKYRLKLSFNTIYEIMKHRTLGIMVLGLLMGLLEWLLIKVPFTGPIISLIFTYISVYSIIIFLENSNTKSVLECLGESWLYTMKHLPKIFMLDIYYLFTPTIIGVGVIVLSQILGMIMSLYFISLFGVLIGCITVIKKLPKSYLSKIIHYLTNPIKR